MYSNIVGLSKLLIVILCAFIASFFVLILFIIKFFLPPIKKLIWFFDTLIHKVLFIWGYSSKILFYNVKCDVSIANNLYPNGWYILISNHQSWIDIMALEYFLCNKASFIKFITKDTLRWLPFINIVGYAINVPFIKRYTREQLEKNTEFRKKDTEAIKKACNTFKIYPTTFGNFVEGTRFSIKKREYQKSPYKHLLVPKAKGVAISLSEMKGYVQNIINATIVYSDDHIDFWSFFCGKVSSIAIRIEIIPVLDNLIGDYENNAEFREFFQNWLNKVWEEKDKLISIIKTQP